MAAPVTFNVPVTPEQATLLLRLIDSAVKSEGLHVAKAAVFFHDLIIGCHESSKEAALPAPVQKAPEPDLKHEELPDAAVIV